MGFLVIYRFFFAKPEQEAWLRTRLKGLSTPGLSSFR